MYKTGLFLFLIMLFSNGCSDKHIISDPDYRKLVETRFNDRKLLAENRSAELFYVLDRKLSCSQTEALMFLYAFMPLSDLADYNGDFFLANADLALRAKKESSWGRNMPDYIFLHYVLPPRVNNENLDSFRILYYDEIRSRIANLPLKEAALEINHWCHEKVTYQPSDIRTSSPMATILSARGRCGEESTFTVAALRAAGIPARQVYTPRWAHTDDNHAWVEIWDNGEWFYLGACEPEPVPDRGWFTEPARRAMLIHTKSYGAAYGNENTIYSTDLYSVVNNLAKYAVTKKITVSVTDAEGRPAENAAVEFKLFNYAEFYTLAKVKTDIKGLCSFETGLGDLLIWASLNGLYDFRKITVAETDTLKLILGKSADAVQSQDIDLGVPIARAPYPGISAELAAENEKRINKENQIRKEYTDSWIKPQEVLNIARQRSVDSTRLESIFKRSMGNYREILTFLSVVPDSVMNRALDLLDVLSDKDLRDIKAVILTDHLFFCHHAALINGSSAENFFTEYVLNPRISNEMVVPWRGYFNSAFTENFIKDALSDPREIIRYLNENIRISEDDNFYKTPITPTGVNELKVADSWSRAICFVAICRSFGIPSRIVEGRLIPQYYNGKEWKDVYFSDQVPPSDKNGFIKLTSTDTKPVPEYYLHFTLARFENGRYITLDYDYNRKVTEFKDFLILPAGKYMLVTGNRISDSRILSNISLFSLAEGEHKNITVRLRNESAADVSFGNLDLERIVAGRITDAPVLNNIKERGAVLIWLDPEKEPSKHIFNDIPKLKSEFDSWGGYFIFLNGKPETSGSFDPMALKDLPAKSFFGSDNKLEILNNLTDRNKFPDNNLPFIMVADKDGKILFRSSGYRIGIGEQILRYLR